MILYFGDPRGALALLDRGAPLCGVVHGRRGGPRWQALVPRVRDLPRWTLPDLEDPAILESFRALRPTLIVSAFYPRRILAPVLDIAPGINVHPSDLPRWRGPDPTHWTVRSGDPETAVCVHMLTEEIDAGDVLLREVHAVGPRETAGHLAERLEARGAELVAEVAVRWIAGDRPALRPQTGEISWAPQVKAAELELDWSAPAAEIDRLVRAAAPDPGAFTGIGDELLVVLQGRPAEAGKFASLPPSTPYVRGGQVFIRCADEAFELQRVRLGRRLLTGSALAGLLT
jgi:methionyl-tRNA formyltransferase